MLIDTHCHIHEASYPLKTAEVLQRAEAAGIGRMICVGTNEQSSREAVEFATKYDNVFASIGVHPHDTKDGWGDIEKILQSRSVFAQAKHLQPELQLMRTQLERGAKPFGEGDDRKGDQDRLVAIGEIGLDYYYTHSPRDVQIKALEEQIDLALKYDLPIIFHVRDAFDDFWPVFDNFHGIRGELHSFTDNQTNLEEGLKRGLYIGVNGISTFTKDPAQQQLFATLSPKHMLFETDAPFLTPAPLRGKINEPAFVRTVAEYHAKIRDMSIEEIASITSANATALFALS